MSYVTSTTPAPTPSIQHQTPNQNTSIMSDLPSNVHVSTHPLLQSKLSLLRSSTTTSRQTASLIHEITLLLASTALSTLPTTSQTTATTPLGFHYTVTTIDTPNITLVPILRSGLSMVDAVQCLMPSTLSVHHLGLYREKSSLQPVEYYNNLPRGSFTPELAIILDPVIATGGTCVAAIQTLREWGVARIVVLSVLGAKEGVRCACEEWAEGVEIWVGGVDEELTQEGMIKPGLGDVGDRLYGTIGK